MTRSKIWTVSLAAVAAASLEFTPVFAKDDPNAPLPQEEVGAAPTWEQATALGEAALKQRLIDPDSAKIEWPYNFTATTLKGLFFKARSGYFTCGTVNSRNSMGGYAGRAYFLIMIKNNEVTLLQVGRNTRTDITQGECENFINQGVLTRVARQSIPAPTAAETVPTGPEPMPSDRPVFGFNFTMVPEGAYVATVTPGSAADTANLKPGMVITAINGVKLKGMPLTTIQAIFAAADGEIILEVVGIGNVPIRKTVIGRPAN